MRLRYSTAALILSVLLVVPGAVAAEDENKAGAATEKRAEPRPAPKDDAANVGGDLASCKRDADGMRGPERSRFMTACLRERK